jgi:membrane fusion protein (multidrug efflux system)
MLPQYVRYALPVLCILSACLLSGCEVSESNEVEEKVESIATKIVVKEVKPEELKDVLVLPGETEARHDLVLAAERDGAVNFIGPKEGEWVKKDDLIAQIDMVALKATLERCEATAKMAESIAERRKSLHDGKMISQEALDQALTDHTLAICNLKEAQVNYEHASVRAPIDGVINKLHIDPGEFVNRGQKVADLVDVRSIRINVQIPEMDVRYIKNGEKVLVTIDAYEGEKWIGEIDLVSFKADPATKTFKARVVVDNQDLRIRPGMIAHVAFLRREIPDAITAPIFSIVDKGGERIVFIEENGIAKARTIEIGVIGLDKVQVTKGLNVGEKLIVKGQHEVEDGMKVIAQ